MLIQYLVKYAECVKIQIAIPYTDNFNLLSLTLLPVISMSSILKFGVLGMGQYGTKIHSKLERMGSVIWAVDSKSDFTKLEIPDWVFIATPNILHYEQVEYFLRSGANVFVEKPATLNPSALEDLINLAKLRGRLFYVDDVFLYRSDLNLDNLDEFQKKFCWHKISSGVDGSLLDRFTYHHLYIIFEALGGQLDFDICSFSNFNPKKIDFDAEINNQRYSFSYSASQDGHRTHTVFGKNMGEAPNDALSEMLMAILNKTASFDENHARALWVTKVIFTIKKKLYKNIAIVGGGIFGSTVAMELASQGYNVVLYERHDNLLEEASSINQYRVHKGYHYPRSSETALECKASVSDFTNYYRQSIVPKSVGTKHYYAIASYASKTDPEKFIDFMDAIDLPYKIVKPMHGTDLMVEVEEDIFDPTKLTSIIMNRLEGAGVDLRLGAAATEDDLLKYDFTVIATYANLNEWCFKKRVYQYELCEKPVLKLPDSYRMKSIVVMDGPFMCIDPLGDGGLHVMGNVVHAIHHTNIGYSPVIPNEYKNLLNKGVVSNPSITNIDKFIQSAQQFFPDIDKAQHIGSMYTIRAVLPFKETDDARPTLVEWVSQNRLVVFSGKICTCIKAAKTVLKRIEDSITANDL